MNRHCERSETIQQSNKAGLLRRCLAMMALLLLGGCILVDDFGAQWNKGVADNCVSKIAESLYYTEFRRDPADKDMANLAHTITVGDAHFLMLKKNAEDKGGRMYRFVVAGKSYYIFQRFRLDPTMREPFEKEHPNAPVSLAHDTVTLAQLGDAEMKLLAEISAKPEYWEIEDQTLYNTMKNPTCQFNPTGDNKDK
jgi:hypothetical protein